MFLKKFDSYAPQKYPVSHHDPTVNEKVDIEKKTTKQAESEWNYANMYALNTL